MRILLTEFQLSLRRIMRRPLQGGLLLGTFIVSITLTLVSWALFHTIFLANPEFDPHGSLFLIGQDGPKSPGKFVGYQNFAQSTREDFEAWKSQQTAFDDFAGVMLYNSIFVRTENGSERLLSANVSSDALRIFGAKPLLGRLFTADEDKIHCAPVIMISEGTWRNKFAADPGIIGRVVKVDDTAATIVGVLPNSFRFPNDQEMWQPLGFSPFERTPQVAVFDVIGRLKPGITPAYALDQLAQITARRGSATFAAQYELKPVMVPFREYYLQPELHQSALILLALSLVFVLVSCANAANLVMIDFFGRSAETASSLALGIPRLAVIRGLGFQLLIASFLAAAVASGVLVLAAPHLYNLLVLPNTPFWLVFTLQWHHFAVAGGLALFCSAVALLAPLTFMLLRDPEELIRSHSGSNRASGRSWWKHVLLVGQVALLTVLAVSAGLLLRTSSSVGEKHWGYDARPMFAAKTAIKDADLARPEQRLVVVHRMLDEFDRLPGVVASAAMTNPVGFSGPPSCVYATTPQGVADGHSMGGAQFSFVSPGVFQTFGVPLLEGESFPADEKPDGPNYAVINVSLAQKLWPGQSALNRVLFVREPDPKATVFPMIVRGVTRDFQASGPKATNNDFIYGSVAKHTPRYLFLYVRGLTRAPSTIDVQAAAHRADPRLPVYLPITMEKQVGNQLGTVRLTSQLTTIYAVAAIILCAIGVYSITVSQITQRSREFGIRLALGIEPERLWARFARGHLAVASIGLGAGLVAAAMVATVMQALLFGVKPHDLATFSLVAGLILAVSVLACVPSLFRLRRINPADCLRSL